MAEEPPDLEIRTPRLKIHRMAERRPNPPTEHRKPQKIILKNIKKSENKYAFSSFFRIFTVPGAPRSLADPFGDSNGLSQPRKTPSWPLRTLKNKKTPRRTWKILDMFLTFFDFLEGFPSSQWVFGGLRGLLRRSGGRRGRRVRFFLIFSPPGPLGEELLDFPTGCSLFFVGFWSPGGGP